MRLGRFTYQLSYIIVSATPDPVPMVTSPLDTLIVSSGVYFEFIIPENTFIDLQDGNTRNLTLSFLDINGQVGGNL